MAETQERFDDVVADLAGDFLARGHRAAVENLAVRRAFGCGISPEWARREPSACMQALAFVVLWRRCPPGGLNDETLARLLRQRITSMNPVEQAELIFAGVRG